MNRPGDFGVRVLINVDGHRLNEPLFDSAFTNTDFFLDVDLVERVEIIHGPGSSLYGDNAFFAEQAGLHLSSKFLSLARLGKA